MNLDEKLVRLSSLQKKYLGQLTKDLGPKMEQGTILRYNATGAKVTFVLENITDIEIFTEILDVLTAKYKEFSRGHLEKILAEFLSPINIEEHSEKNLFIKLDKIRESEVKEVTVLIRLDERYISPIEYNKDILIGRCTFTTVDGKKYVKITVKGGDIRKIEELAEQKLEETYNILAILINNHNLSPIVLTYQREYIIQMGDTKTESFSNKGLDHLTQRFNLERAVDFFEKQKLISKINTSCNNDNPTLYDKKLRRAIYWLGTAVRTEDNIIAYLYSIQVLESLLKGEEEKTELTRLISQRGAYILGHRYNLDPLMILSLLEKSYNARSKIIHRGDIDKVDIENVNKIKNFARIFFLDFIYFKEAGLSDISNQNNEYFEKLDAEIIAKSSKFKQKTEGESATPAKGKV